ncbi:MAG: hypothetical protein KDD55_10855 [Bdellovibrionales bacterium]|nr:hypothetical protein [Bdellovibrionales bacterium]
MTSQATFRTNLLLATVVPLFFLLLIEGASRLIESFSPDKEESMTLDMPSWMVEAHNSPKTFSTKELQWMKLFQSGEGYRVHLQPNISALIPDTFSWTKYLPGAGFEVHSNEKGFRILPPEHQSEQPPQKRIIFFGDSSTFGWGVDGKESYPFRLQEELKEKGLSEEYQIANFAMPGDSSEFGRLLFDHFAPTEMGDIAVLSFGANDARLSSVPHRSQVNRFQEQALLQSVRGALTAHSAFVRFIDKALQPPLKTVAENNRTAAVPLKRYKGNMRHMIRKSREYGAKQVLLVAVCSPAPYARALKRVAQNEGALYYNAQVHLRNLIPSLQKEKKYASTVKEMKASYGGLLKKQPVLYVTSDGCHPNKIGNHVIAKRLAKMLSQG